MHIDTHVRIKLAPSSNAVWDEGTSWLFLFSSRSTELLEVTGRVVAALLVHKDS